MQWTEKCREAFEAVKRKLTSFPVLHYPRFGQADEFILTTDASDVGAGAVLSQMQDGVEKPLGYGSVAFHGAQLNYSATEKELAALKFGIKHFKYYLYGRAFIIRVDHQAIIYLNQCKNFNNRLFRKYEDLQIGDYKIEYVPGKENVVADALSRAPLSNAVHETDSSVESPQVDEVQPIFEPAGGPDSLFQCLQWACRDSYSASSDELRVEMYPSY